MDRQSIQSKLIQKINTLNQGDAAVQVDWAGGPQLPLTPPGPEARQRPSVDLSVAVDALQWRAENFGGFAPQAAVNGSSVPAAAVPAQAFLKRLSAMADKINYLSAEQERAITEIQSIHARLAHLPVQFTPQGQPVSPPAVDISRAALASAEVDRHGNIFLSYRTVAPGAASAGTTNAPTEHSPRDADQLATHLRATYGPPAGSSGWSNLAADVLALGKEPMQILSDLGRTVWSLVLGMTQWSARRQAGGQSGVVAGRTPSRDGELSLVDSVLWLGGGVIGRLALNLLLAAFPALWSVAVAAITAITAYALYRATLAPRLAFGPAIRVFLLVVGLVIGGQL
ncbi:MAG: hypothetical protein ACFCVB_01895 [Nodosilinea sp.]